MTENVSLVAVNHLVHERLGMRATVSEVTRQDKGYRVVINYSHQFCFETDKTVFVKTIRLPHVYEEKFISLEDLQLPFQDVQHAIKTKWQDLGDRLYTETIEEYAIVDALLKLDIPISFIHPFNELITNLILESELTSEYTTYLKDKKNGLKYLTIAEKNEFIVKKSDGYAPTEQFKKFLLDNNEVPLADKVRRAVAHIVCRQHHMIKSELQMNHLEPYLKLVSALRWIARNVNHPLSVEGIHSFYSILFRRMSLPEFKNKINQLHVRTSLFIFKGNLISIKPEYV